MAERADPSSVPRPRPGRRKYPWHEWTDGDWWRLKRGADYKVTDDAFRSITFTHARRNGLKVRTRLYDGGIFIQFFQEEGE